MTAKFHLLYNYNMPLIFIFNIKKPTIYVGFLQFYLIFTPSLASPQQQHEDLSPFLVAQHPSGQPIHFLPFFLERITYQAASATITNIIAIIIKLSILFNLCFLFVNSSLAAKSIFCLEFFITSINKHNHNRNHYGYCYKSG